MKKIFALLCVVAVLAVINGCKKADEAAPANTADKPAATEAAPATDMPADKPAESGMPAEGAGG